MLRRYLSLGLLACCLALPAHAEHYMGSVFFGGNSSTLSRDDKAHLHEWLPILKASQAGIYVLGYTEAASPNGEMNRHVALDRAKAVAKFLTSNGINPRRLLLAGKPDCCYPLSPDFTRPLPKYPNRRADILLASNHPNAAVVTTPPSLFNHHFPPAVVTGTIDPPPLATTESLPLPRSRLDTPLNPSSDVATTVAAGNVFYYTDDPDTLDHPDELGVRVGRYTKIEPTATKPQRELLSNVVTAHLPASSRIGDAVNILLEDSGYKLALGLPVDPAQNRLLAMSLPRAHRKLGPITLESALQIIAGKAFRLVVDPIHRLVSFELNSAYRPQPKAIPVLRQRSVSPPAKPVCDVKYRIGKRYERCTYPTPPPPPPPVDLITQQPRKPCPPLGDGTLERDLTVRYADRRYFLVDGSTCTPWKTIK